MMALSASKDTWYDIHWVTGFGITVVVNGVGLARFRFSTFTLVDLMDLSYCELR
jgi:hypothetical protein